MAIKFKINRLGNIKNSEIELNKFLIFSGDSNSGKSYTAILIYQLMNLFEYTDQQKSPIQDFVNDRYLKTIEHLKKEENATFAFKAKDFLKWFNGKTTSYFKYMLNHSEFECDVELKGDFKDFEIKFFFPKTKSNDDQQLLGGGERVSIEIEGSEEVPYTSNITFIKTKPIEVISLIIGFELRKQIMPSEQLVQLPFFPAFFPPARGLFSGMSNSELKAMYSSTGINETFLKTIDIINKPILNQNTTSPIGLDLLAEIMDGDISITKDGKLEYKPKGTNIVLPLTAAASSIKELAYVYMFMTKYTINNSMSLLFEEPEAHLHPLLQHKISFLLSYIANGGAYLQITTHSDYLLSRLNNLIRLYKIKNDPKKLALLKKKKRLELDLSFSINPAIVGSYFFEKKSDGFVKIVKHDVINNDIPFDSFKKTVDVMTNETKNVIDILYSDDN